MPSLFACFHSNSALDIIFLAFALLLNGCVAKSWPISVIENQVLNHPYYFLFILLHSKWGWFFSVWLASCSSKNRKYNKAIRTQKMARTDFRAWFFLVQISILWFQRPRKIFSANKNMRAGLSVLLKLAYSQLWFLWTSKGPAKKFIKGEFHKIRRQKTKASSKKVHESRFWRWNFSI